jgi:hypothetical protein
MGDVGAWLPFFLALLLVLGWYLSYSAARLDRLHHRVESARAALDTQLVRRAAAAAELAGLLPLAAGRPLAEAAAAALKAGLSESAHADGRPGGRTLPLSEVESELTRALHRAVAAVPRPVPERGHGDSGSVDAELMATLRSLNRSCERVQLARRFHNDAVAQSLRMRAKRIIRWTRLAGHAPEPRMIDLDDRTPPGLQH